MAIRLQQSQDRMAELRYGLAIPVEALNASAKEDANRPAIH